MSISTAGGGAPAFGGGAGRLSVGFHDAFGGGAGWPGIAFGGGDGAFTVRGEGGGVNGTLDTGCAGQPGAGLNAGGAFLAGGPWVGGEVLEEELSLPARASSSAFCFLCLCHDSISGGSMVASLVLPDFGVAV